MKKNNQMTFSTKDQFLSVYSKKDITWYYLEPNKTKQSFISSNTSKGSKTQRKTQKSQSWFDYFVCCAAPRTKDDESSDLISISKSLQSAKSIKVGSYTSREPEP